MGLKTPEITKPLYYRRENFSCGQDPEYKKTGQQLPVGCPKQEKAAVIASVARNKLSLKPCKENQRHGAKIGIGSVGAPHIRLAMVMSGIGSKS